MSTAMSAAPMTRAETKALVLLTLAQVVLFLVPLFVLGKAIGWPASLRLPAAEALPLIDAQAAAVQIGYWGYLLTAAAMVPFVVALRRYAVAQGAGGMAADIMAAFGIAAAVLKTLGIVRWLIAMPSLATLYANTVDPTMRSAIEVNYVVLNSYAGSVGELLGVQLFSGIWLILLGFVLRRAGLRLNGAAAAVLGFGFALASCRTLVPELALLGTIVPPVALVWLLVFAATLYREA